MKKTVAILLFALLVAFLCSCGEKIGGPYFPAVPDKIVIGISGVESTVVPGDEAFDEIVARVRKIVDMSGGLYTTLLDAGNHGNGHMSYEVRESEIFVEFIYNTPRKQSLVMGEGYGKTSLKEMDIQRVFFPLSGQYKDEIFIGSDSEYKTHTTIGAIDVGESFASYIAGLLAPVD